MACLHHPLSGDSMPINPESSALRKESPGFGLGLRPVHYQDFLREPQAVDWLEIISENYMIPGGKPMAMLDAILERYQVAMHGVSLSIGSTDGLNAQYLSELKALARHAHPLWISDHLCWTGVQGRNAHDLLPLPYSEEALRVVVQHVNQVQDMLGQRILLENVSSYLDYRSSEMSEWEFLRQVSERADCLLLLDVNNIYVSSVNHGFDAIEFLDHLPVARVQQIHLAGHSDHGDYIVDTHDHPVAEPVWQLYRHTCAHFGAVATMIERDDDIPELGVLIAELNHARTIAADTLATGMPEEQEKVS
jgi:uncharacterized protein (UPF0276 family)